MATIDVKDAAGATVAIEKPLTPGRAAATSSRPVALSNEDKTALDALVTAAQDTTTPSPVGGAIAHDAADSGNPVKIGGKAVDSLSGLTLVAAADRTDASFARDGAQFVRHIPLLDLQRGVAAVTDGSSTSVISAPGASTYLYVTDVTIANSSASNVTVDLRDGTAGSVLWTLPAPANGGVTHKFESPLKLTANTALAADPSAAASTITVSVSGFKSKIG